MDKEVLIEFIKMIGGVLGRVNSKRLLTLYAFLYWLYEMALTLGPWWCGSLGAASTAFVLWTYWREGKDELPVVGNPV